MTRRPESLELGRFLRVHPFLTLPGRTGSSSDPGLLTRGFDPIGRRYRSVRGGRVTFDRSDIGSVHIASMVLGYGPDDPGRMGPLIRYRSGPPGARERSGSLR